MNCTYPPPPPTYPSTNSDSVVSANLPLAPTTTSRSTDPRFWWNNNNFTTIYGQPPLAYPSTSTEWYPPKKSMPILGQFGPLPRFPLQPPPYYSSHLEPTANSMSAITRFEVAATTPFPPESAPNPLPPTLSDPAANDSLIWQKQKGPPKIDYEIPQSSTPSPRDHEESPEADPDSLTKTTIKRRRRARVRRLGEKPRLPRRRFEACWGSGTYPITTPVGLRFSDS